MGLAWRSARGLRAGQSGEQGLQGSWESLLSPRTEPERITPEQQDPRLRARARFAVAKKVGATEEPDAERNAKARGDRGSLSISIVAIESGVTHPKEPASSQGGYRDYGLITGNAPGAQNPDECVSPKVMDSLGGETVA